MIPLGAWLYLTEIRSPLIEYTGRESAIGTEPIVREWPEAAVRCAAAIRQQLGVERTCLVHA